MMKYILSLLALFSIAFSSEIYSANYDIEPKGCYKEVIEIFYYGTFFFDQRHLVVSRNDTNVSVSFHNSDSNARIALQDIYYNMKTDERISPDATYLKCSFNKNNECEIYLSNYGNIDVKIDNANTEKTAHVSLKMDSTYYKNGIISFLCGVFLNIFSPFLCTSIPFIYICIIALSLLFSTGMSSMMILQKLGTNKFLIICWWIFYSFFALVFYFFHIHELYENYVLTLSTRFIIYAIYSIVIGFLFAYLYIPPYTTSLNIFIRFALRGISYIFMAHSSPSFAISVFFFIIILFTNYLAEPFIKRIRFIVCGWIWKLQSLYFPRDRPLKSIDQYNEETVETTKEQMKQLIDYYREHPEALNKLSYGNMAMKDLVKGTISYETFMMQQDLFVNSFNRR